MRSSCYSLLNSFILLDLHYHHSATPTKLAAPTKNMSMSSSFATWKDKNYNEDILLSFHVFGLAKYSLETANDSETRLTDVFNQHELAYVGTRRSHL